MGEGGEREFSLRYPPHPDSGPLVRERPTAEDGKPTGGEREKPGEVRRERRTRKR